MEQMAKWADEFRQGWRGIAQPSLLMAAGFAVICLAVATAGRWSLSLIRPELAFTLYFPAVLFATAFGGFRIGVATAVAGGLLGSLLSFGEPPSDTALPVLMLIYLVVSALIIWGTGHYRSVASRHHDLSK